MLTPSTQDPCDPRDAQSCLKAIFFGEGISYVSRVVIVVIIEKVELMKGGQTHSHFI